MREKEEKAMKSEEECREDLGSEVESGCELSTLDLCIKVPDRNLLFKNIEMEK